MDEQKVKLQWPCGCWIQKVDSLDDAVPWVSWENCQEHARITNGGIAPVRMLGIHALSGVEFIRNGLTIHHREGA